MIHYIHFVTSENNSIIAVKSSGGNKPNPHLPAQSKQQEHQKKPHNTPKSNNNDITDNILVPS